MNHSLDSEQFFQQFETASASQGRQRTAAHEQLGQPVLEKSYGPKGGDITLLVVGLIFIGMAIASLILNPRDWKVVIFGGLGATSAVMGAWPLLRNPKWFFYQKGLIERTRWNETTIVYSDVAQLTYIATRILINHHYHHTAIEMQLRPRIGGKIKVQHIYKEKTGSTSKDRAGNVIEQVRDFIAQDIAARMLDALKRQSSVPWTQGVSIRRDGLDISSPRGDVQSFTWSQLQGGSNQPGKLQLVSKETNRPIVTIPMKASNFYPGNVLLNSFAQANSVERK